MGGGAGTGRSARSGGIRGGRVVSGVAAAAAVVVAVVLAVLPSAPAVGRVAGAPGAWAAAGVAGAPPPWAAGVAGAGARAVGRLPSAGWPQRFGLTSSPGYLRRWQPSAATVGEPPSPKPRPYGPAPPAGAGAVAPGARYAWPMLPPPPVVTAFDEPADPYGRGHRGVDLAGTPGQAVLAADAGVIVHAGPLAGRGVVSVQHPDGLRTTYEPVTPVVTPGAVVSRGAVLGVLEPGHPGCPRACLHWGVRRDRRDYVDPLVLLRPPRVRLLPVPDSWPR